MFSRKPFIAVYDLQGEKYEVNGMNLNMLYSDDGKLYSFRCPNKSCGRPVKVGFSSCPFCKTRLKWKYPFDVLKE